MPEEPSACGVVGRNVVALLVLHSASMSLFARKPKKGQADEARAFHESNLFTKLRTKPFLMRMGVVYAGSFIIGATVEFFACKTGLYQTVANKKATRRLEIDTFVADMRENLDKWTKEDMARAEHARAPSAPPVASK